MPFDAVEVRHGAHLLTQLALPSLRVVAEAFPIPSFEHRGIDGAMASLGIEAERRFEQQPRFELPRLLRWARLSWLRRDRSAHAALAPSQRIGARVDGHLPAVPMAADHGDTDHSVQTGDKLDLPLAGIAKTVVGLVGPGGIEPPTEGL